MQHESIEQGGTFEHEPSPAEKVRESIDRLNIDLDLSNQPELCERLADIGDHFEDSLDMARIVESIYQDLRTELQLTEESPKRLMRAAVLHDIGKSGPSGEKGEIHYAVQRLFITPEQPFSPYAEGRKRTISEFIEFLGETTDEDTDRIRTALTDHGINPDEEAIIDFWRRHAEWTYDILNSTEEKAVDDETIVIAASHHIFENRNPAHLDLKHVPAEANVLEVLEMSEMLAAVDKYQAMRDRGQLKHEDAIARLRSTFNAKPPELPDTLRTKYQSVINVLERHHDDLEEVG